MNYKPSSLNILFSYVFIVAIVVIVAISNSGVDSRADAQADGAGNNLTRYVADIDAEAAEYVYEEPSMTGMPMGTTGSKQATATVPAGGSAAVKTAQPAEHWFINLTSLDSREKANSYVKNARAKGIRAAQKEVTVNGRQFWRVYVSGYTSHDAASAESDSIKSRLRLKEVWIARDS